MSGEHRAVFGGGPLRASHLAFHLYLRIYLSVRFEWDDNKDRQSQWKHGLSFRAALEAFSDPKRVVLCDSTHSGGEVQSGSLEPDTGAQANECITGRIQMAEPNPRDEKNYEEAPPEVESALHNAQELVDELPPPDQLVSRKRTITIRLDGDIVDWFKQQGGQYQTLINEVLRRYRDRFVGRR
jgi:uncharacterized protein (DUF4415 family)